MEKHFMIKKGIIGAVCAAVLVLLDQLTKRLAVSHLMNQEPFIIWDGVFELRYLENRGSAFGMMQNKLAFLVPMTVIVCAVIAYIYLRRIPNERRFRWLDITAVLFIAGAIGNFIDRVVQGYVVDFFYFILIDFPIFNVADIYVVVAAFLLFGLCLFYYKEEDFETIFPSKGKKDAAAKKDSTE